MNYSKKLKRNSSKKNSINRRNTKNVRNRRNTQNIRNRRRINKSIKYGGMDGFKLDDDIERLDDDIESIETTNVKLKPSEDMIGLLEGMDAGELAEYAKKPDEFGLAAQWKLQQLGMFSYIEPHITHLENNKAMVPAEEYLQHSLSEAHPHPHHAQPSAVPMDYNGTILELYEKILTVEECKNFLSGPLMRNDFIRIYNKKTLILKTLDEIDKYSRWWSYNDFIIVFLYAYKILGRFMPNTIPKGEEQVIVSVGESPFKLCFAMDCFLKDINDTTMEGTMITFPISSLKYIRQNCIIPLWRIDVLEPALEHIKNMQWQTLDGKTINTQKHPEYYNEILIPVYNGKRLEPDYVLECYEEYKSNMHNRDHIRPHFMNFNISPTQILERGCHHKFIDRSESTEGIDMLLFVYKYLTELEELIPIDKRNFLTHFHIICFDAIYDSQVIIHHKIRFMRYIAWALFRELDLSYDDLKNIVSYEDIFFVGVANRPDSTFVRDLKELYNTFDMKTQPTVFKKKRELYTANKMVDYLSVPEKTFCLNRCVKSTKILQINEQTVSELQTANPRKFNHPPMQRQGMDNENLNPFDFCNLDLLMMVNIYYQKEIYKYVLPLIRDSIRIQEWMIDACLPSLIVNEFDELEGGKDHVIDFILRTHLNFTDVSSEWFNRELIQTYINNIQNPQKLAELNNMILLTSKLSIFSEENAICGNFFYISKLNNSVLQEVCNYDGLSLEDGFDYYIKPRILLLDLDETLGQFNIQFFIVYQQVINILGKTPELYMDKLLDISRILLPHLVRSDFPIFINCLERLLQTNAIFKIYITTSNKAEGEYIKDLVYILQKIFIDNIIIPPENIITGKNSIMNKRKDITSFSKMGNVYIIDDKTQNITKTREQHAISISPVFNYIPYQIINEVLSSFEIKPLSSTFNEINDTTDEHLLSDYKYVMTNNILQTLMIKAKETNKIQQHNNDNDLIKILMKDFSVLQGWNKGRIFDISIEEIIAEVCQKKELDIDINELRATVERERGLGVFNLTRTGDRDISSVQDEEDEEVIFRSNF